MKMKEFGPPGGHASLAPPLDLPMVIDLNSNPVNKRFLAAENLLSSPMSQHRTEATPEYPRWRVTNPGG